MQQRVVLLNVGGRSIADSCDALCETRCFLQERRTLPNSSKDGDLADNDVTTLNVSDSWPVLMLASSLQAAVCCSRGLQCQAAPGEGLWG
jgi:hypothetical protein